MREKVASNQWSALCILNNIPNWKRDKHRCYKTRHKTMSPERLPKREFCGRTDDTECKPPPFPATYSKKIHKDLWFYLPTLQKCMKQTKPNALLGPGTKANLLIQNKQTHLAIRISDNVLWFSCCRGKQSHTKIGGSLQRSSFLVAKQWVLHLEQ